MSLRGRRMAECGNQRGIGFLDLSGKAVATRRPAGVDRGVHPGVDRERVAPLHGTAACTSGGRALGPAHARTLRGRREFKLCWLTTLARRVGYAVQRASRRPWEEPR